MRLLTALMILLTSPAFAAAQVRFTQTTADLGELRGGLVYQHRFEFVNESPGPIEITDIRLGCGCLQSSLDQRTFQRGEKGTLTMNLRTLGQPDGARTWQAHVQYRQGAELRETTLIVAAKIRNEVTVEPSIIAMTVETTLKHELTITDHRMTPLKVVKVLASSPAVQIQIQPPMNGVTTVIIEVSGSALKAGRQEEVLNIYTDDPYYRHLQVPITLTKVVRASVSASPERVEIVGADSQIVRLRAGGDQAVRIVSVDADHTAIKCTWAAGPGNEATLRIVVNPERLTTPSATANVRVLLGTTTLTIPVALRKE